MLVVVLASFLTSIASGTPVCQPALAGGGPPTVKTDEEICRDANEAVAGPHKERVYWQQIAGAPYPEEEVKEGPTTFDTDLYTVRARNARDVFAAGAACAQTPEDPSQVDACPRVPVIYGQDEDRPWHRSYRSEDPGYVGAVAWIKRGEAIAVGGTGTYPRREPNPKGDARTYAERLAYDKAPANGGAGDARAWHFYDDTWHEITDSLPEEMGGLSALDVWIGREDDGDEWGLAGDYGHIWEWEGGEFTPSHLDKDSPSIGATDPEWAVVEGPTQFVPNTDFGAPPGSWKPASPPENSASDLFQYRVREIRIAPDKNQKRAFAFTSGCCGSDATTSRRIEYVERPRKNRTGVNPNANPPPPAERPRWIVSDQSYYNQSADGTNESVYSFALKPNRFNNTQSEPDQFGEAQPDHASMTWSVDTASGVVKSSAAPDGQSSTATPSPAAQTPPRYVASDGDTERTDSQVYQQPVNGNGVPDWKVGEATQPDVDGAGVLTTTREDLKPYYGGLRPYCNLPLTSVENGGNWLDEAVIPLGRADVRVCRAEQIQAGEQPRLDPDGPIKTKESGVQYGPSWALNSVEMLESENVGYAVGDHGAILRMSSPPAESDPPSLGSRRATQLNDHSPYDEHRPEVAAQAGEVPALAVQARDVVGEPRMVRHGSPDGNEIAQDLPPEDVNTIVMSRDGSEGWAIGPSIEARRSRQDELAGLMTFHSYDGGQWRRCDPVGIPGLVGADRACSALAALYRHADSGGGRILIDAASRVPLEYDSDPTNDDELEIIAVGSRLGMTEAPGSRPIPTVFRYSEGRWRLEDLEIRRSLTPDETNAAGGLVTTSLACLGSDECWLAGRPVGGTGPVLSRFDGKRWTECTIKPNRSTDPSVPLKNSSACGDQIANRLASLQLAGTTTLTVASAGERVYLGGVRSAAKQGVIDTVANSPLAPAQVRDLLSSNYVPAILYKDYGEDAQWMAEQGGYNPGAEDSGSVPIVGSFSGKVASIAVAERIDGSYEGWAVGAFGGAKWPLLRLDPETQEWEIWRVRDASYDILGPTTFRGSDPRRQVTLAGTGETPGRAYIGTGTLAPEPGAALFFDPAIGRWGLLETPSRAQVGEGHARPLALAPDGSGGIWAAFGSEAVSDAYLGRSETYFYNYTTHPPREVFNETPVPFATPREKLTDLTGAQDGTVWASTDAGALYRYDRLTGWERTTVPGWDPGRVVTRRTPIDAVAIAPDGAGLAVGEGGRIANLSSSEVRLDDAAGTVCELGAPEAPCGTSFDLVSAAIAPDGAAMVAGKQLALLARSPGGDFARITAPDASPAATITGVAMPSSNSAWLALDSGQVFTGELDGKSWSWSLENAIEINGADRLLSEDAKGEPIALRDIAIDENGRGFAVGDRGLVLERTGDPSQPWRRVDSGVTEVLHSVALPAGSGPGALIGGDRGLVLTYTAGEWRTARPGDQLRPDNGFVAGVALVPGVAAGQAEAWAGVAPTDKTRGRTELDNRTGTSQLLHFTNAPSEPLLDPTREMAALPDVPAPRPDEISFAAFGRSDCHFVANTKLWPCMPLANGTEPEQTILRRIRDEMLARSEQPGGPAFSIWTGDAYDTPGNTGLEAVEQNSKLAENGVCLATAVVGAGADCLRPGAQKYRRFNEQLTDYLPSRGLPLFAAVGARDLSETRYCQQPTYVAGTQPYCVENRDRPRVGENIVWRQAMEDQPGPWGGGDPIASAELAFEPVDAGGLALEREDQRLEEQGGEEGVADPVEVPTGGAATHYAVDVVSTQEERSIARLVVVDTSPGSLTAADPLQSPIEADGGQAAWLERVLCIEGSATDTGQCTREPTQQAIVVSTTPTYSYGPTTPTETQADAAVFESILLRHRTNVVVSGRLGWNGRYWATAPGVHEPCPGEPYVPDSQAPAAGTRVCGRGTPAGVPDPQQAAAEAQGDAAETLNGTGGAGILPFVVASGAGGRFDDLAQQSGATASDGLWRGYSIVRLDPSGDPRKTIVEQRPVFDWVGMTANQRVLGARQRLRLQGVGREPITTKVTYSGTGGGRYDEITSPAITHRYDLLLAHPDEPWRACSDSEPDCLKLQTGLERGGQAEATAALASSTDTSAQENPCAPYLCLPERIGQIDSQTGQVRAGDGRYPDTFAIALLSVGEHVAAYPLAFEKSPSFVAKSPLRVNPLPQPQKLTTPEPPPPPDTPTPPRIPQIDVPAIPAPPAIPPMAAATLPEPQPPAPPAPPPPSQQPAALDLTVAPPGVSISTPTALIQPPTPPVNPAPPGGARREARQRQAAAQKGGADSSEGADEAQSGGGDLVDGPATPPGSAFTRFEAARHQHMRPGPSFTTLTRADPAGPGQGVLYAGGIALAAAALALGFSTLRPGSRRREPYLPAPAWAPPRRR